MKSIYVFKSMRNHPIKIGMSGNPEQRIKSLRVNTTNKYSLFYTKPVNIPGRLEKRIHHVLAKYLIGQEWFNYSFKKAIWIIRNMVNDYENIPKKKKASLKALQKEMKRKRLSIKDLAEKVGVSKQTINNWLAGTCSPSFENMDALEALEFSETAYMEPSKEV